MPARAGVLWRCCSCALETAAFRLPAGAPGRAQLPMEGGRPVVAVCIFGSGGGLGRGGRARLEREVEGCRAGKNGEKKG